MVEFKAWLKFAYDDLLNCKAILHNDILTNIVAFHSQQAIEKSLKALLLYHEHDVPRIHSLNKLFKMNSNYIKINNPIMIVDLLDKLYIESRYPSSFGLLPYGKPTLEDAKEFYNFALEVFNKVCDMLEINKEEFS